MNEKITPAHTSRKAIVYIRQSSAYQVAHNTESRRLQYAMRDCAGPTIVLLNGCECIDREFVEQLSGLRDLGSGVGKAYATRSLAIRRKVVRHGPSARTGNAVVRCPNNRGAD